MSRGFQFKQFFVAHDKCAMKVNTDSILLGSWVSVADHKHMLDIGCGSGLLSLMLAQESHEQAKVIGVDVEENAVEQARDNIECSPWSNKITIFQQDIKEFAHADYFDLIICNPPFYANHSAHQANLFRNPQRKLARQTDTLPFPELLKVVELLLDVNGDFYCTLPSTEGDYFRALANKEGLNLARLMKVASVEGMPASRYLMHFSKKVRNYSEENLSIYQSHKHYTDEFKALCHKFYLHF